MNDIHTIRPGIGLGDLYFGSSQDRTRSYVGPPDKVSSDEDAGDRTEAWYYESLGLSLHFNEEDSYRLGTIEAFSKDAILGGHRLIGQAERHVLESIAEIDLGERKVEHHDLEDEGDARGCLISFDDSGLNFWFEDGILTEIQWGVLVNEKDELDWPTGAPENGIR